MTPPAHSSAPGPRLAPNKVLRLRTPRFTHHNLSFSPFFEDRLALASGANFGLVGNGRIHVVLLDPACREGLRVVSVFDTQDCVYDVAWNELHENQLVGACGNGAIKLFDVTLEGLPIKSWHEHSAEIMSVDWNNLQKDTFATASWDQTVKIWNVEHPRSTLTIPAHAAQIYSASFSPHAPTLLASCASDGLVKIFDLRSPSSGQARAVQTIGNAEPGPGHGAIEVLSCDWNKYDPAVVATANKDGTVRIFDLRNINTKSPTGQTGGGEVVGRHPLAARKVQWSPHRRDTLASVSYDMTCRIWSMQTQTQPHSPQSGFCHSEHTEFVMALGWALFDPGLLATAAWDEQLHLFRSGV